MDYHSSGYHDNGYPEYYPTEDVRDPGMAYPYVNSHQYGGIHNQGYNGDYQGLSGKGKDPRMTNGGPGRYTGHDDFSYITRSVSRGPTNYLVEHLASFPQDGRSGFVSPDDALNRLKRISAGGGLWAQVMSMKVTDELVTMANGETMEIIEEYPLDQIGLCTHILNDPMFENLLIFTTKPSSDKVGAVHLFQCRSGEAPVISSDINKRVKHEAQFDGMQNGYHSHSVEQPRVPEPQPKRMTEPIKSTEPVQNQSGIDPKRPMSLQQKPFVAQAVNAFQRYADNREGQPIGQPIGGQPLKQTTSLNPADYPDVKSPLEDARINRDVEILNHCIEEVENFVISLKHANEARKLLASKKKKKGKKYEILQLQAQPPPDARVTDIYQKFKYSFNLLGRLRPHISSPNSPELVHYLMVPLHIITKVTGVEKCRNIVNPLLTVAAVDLLGNCLTSREYDFWQSLGPNWTLTKTSAQFRDKYLPPYTPIFTDGWVPPELIANEKEEAAARSAAAMVARMKSTDEDQRRKLNNNLQYRQDQPKTQVDGPEKAAKQAIVVYDYVAHNNKELTIRSGEKVLVLDDSRRWWLVRNGHSEQGYVPSTVLEFPPEDSSDSSSFDGSGPPSPPSSGYNTAVIAPSVPNPLYARPQKSASLDRAQPRQEVVQQTTIQQQVVHRTHEINTATQAPQIQKPTPLPTIVVPTPPPPPPPQFSSAVPPPPPPPDIPVNVSAPPPAAPKPSVKRPEPQRQLSTENFHSELRNRLSTSTLTTSHPAAVEIDGVDIFIPLYKSSTADDVSRWLGRLKFSDHAIAELKGTTAKELFKFPRDSLIERLGEVEGSRLYEELLVQAGAHTKQKTMTEFQKVLIQRMQKREDSEKEELQKKFEEQQALIRKQQQELEKLKGREPEKPTFSTFNGPTNSNSFNFASQSAQGKTKF